MNLLTKISLSTKFGEFIAFNIFVFPSLVDNLEFKNIKSI
jgi:hypothetical protein